MAGIVGTAMSGRTIKAALGISIGFAVYYMFLKPQVDRLIA